MERKSKRCLCATLVIAIAIVIAGLVVAFLLFPEHIFNALSGLTSSNGCPENEDPCDIRLNPNVLPLHYDLYLNPDFDSGAFSGTVDIKINVTKEPTDHIRLHIKYLNITSSELLHDDQGIFKPLEVYGEEMASLEYWVIRSNSTEAFQTGLYTIRMAFQGSMVRDLTGIYRSSYVDPSTNTSRFVVSSKFQSTYARRAFPCFDEPSFKSTFTLSLVKPSSLVALSNMPIQTEEMNTPSSGLTTVRYEKSVAMVTYLVALAIGDFSYTESRSSRGVPVRVYSTSFQVHKTKYATEITPKILDFYELYFKTEYPLPKLDVVGIPDFVSGAMEHWGMISFRESNLLYQPGVGSAYNKKRVAAVLAHELAHMWFGNLVTLKWWDDLWLNEGFASYMEYKGVDAVHPDWQIHNQFLPDDFVRILAPDGLRSSHPIVQEVSNPNQITELFDTISYSKGASVIRMLERVLGAEAFQNGVASFLKKYSFDNAVTEDLWESLQAEVDVRSKDDMNLRLNVRQIMDTWTRQMGYPRLILRPPKQGNKWIVEQERFLESKGEPNPSDKDDTSPFSYRWQVPVNYQWKTFENPAYASDATTWISSSASKGTLDMLTRNATNVKWVKLNRGHYGFYRSQYPDEMYRDIADDFQVDWTPGERCGVLTDALALSFASYLRYDVSLDFLRSLRQERHLVPWDCVNGQLNTLSNLLRGNDQQTHLRFQKYVRYLVDEIYPTLPWTDSESDPQQDRLMKPLIFSLACGNGHQECLGKAVELLQQWLEDPEGENPIPSSLRSIVYKWGIHQSGNNELWEKLLILYHKESDAQEKVRMLQALCTTKDMNLLKRMLSLADDPEIVRRQEYFSVYKFISRNPSGEMLLWNYYRDNYEKLVERFTLNDRSFGRTIGIVSSRFSTPKLLREVEDFLQKNPEGGAGSRARKAAVENIKNNIQWSQANVGVISNYLSSLNL